MSRGEIILVIIIALVLFSLKKLGDIFRGLEKGVERFTDELSKSMGEEGFRGSALEALMLWAAQGFGSGLAPKAPGTFGSVVGLLWTAALLALGNTWLYLVGALLGVLASVLLCGEAERILRAHDPGSVVIDEIIALPICFIAFLWPEYARTGQLPSVEWVFVRHWPWVLAIFVLFRLFDVAKPWPVKQSQVLRGGLGVTADDVLAAVYVNLVLLVVMAVRG